MVGGGSILETTTYLQFPNANLKRNKPGSHTAQGSDELNSLADPGSHGTHWDRPCCLSNKNKKMNKHNFLRLSLP